MPKAEVPDVLREVHDEVSSGHPNVKKTLLTVRETLYLLRSWHDSCTIGPVNVLLILL